jgi:branched-chain amino acid aminotransferase
MNQQVFLDQAFFQNKFTAFSEAKISIATHSLHYGTAAFGGLRGLINPSSPNQIFLFRLEDHCQRLSDSAKFLNYKLEPSFIQQKIIQFIQANKPKKDFYIRPLIYTSDLGISPRIHNLQKDLLIYGIELGDYLDPEGISCRFSSWQRQADHSFPLRGKISGAYITSSLAKTEAVTSGFDESIMLNSQGKVCEATGMNLFLVRNGQLITPSVDQDILEGITRRSVLQIAKNLNIKITERMVDKSELLIASEVFLTGTAAKITPVKKIENYSLPKDKPITAKLKQELTNITLNKNKDYQNWVKVVEI